jgi:serine acetyltransferase
MNLINNKLAEFFLSQLKEYNNHLKYWKRRQKVVNLSEKTLFLIKLYNLHYIKIANFKSNCSFGTNLHSESHFETPPNLRHAQNGIIIGRDLFFFENITIYNKVTIAYVGGIIGNNILFKAGSKVLAGISIGSGVKIKMNAVIVEVLKHTLPLF